MTLNKFYFCNINSGYMYKEHQNFKYDRSDDAPIWKYMDFYKLKDLLQTNELYFRRGGLLSDVEEGNISDFSGEDTYYPVDKPKRSVYEDISEIAGHAKKHLYITCWNQNEQLCDRMWQHYTSEGDGVCIKTDIKSLIASISHEKRQVQIGKVNYVSNRHKSQSWLGIFSPFLIKDMRFLHENELRMIVRDTKNLDDEPEHQEYLRIKCKAYELIQEIHIAPGAGRLFSKNVKKLAREQGLSELVVR